MLHSFKIIKMIDMEMGSNLTSEHDHSRPADILLPNWAPGKPATSPLNPQIVSVYSGIVSRGSCLVH